MADSQSKGRRRGGSGRGEASTPPGLGTTTTPGSNGATPNSHKREGNARRKSTKAAADTATATAPSELSTPVASASVGPPSSRTRSKSQGGTPHRTPPSHSNRGDSTGKKKNKSRNALYKSHLPLTEIQVGLKSGILLQSVLRCNPNDRTSGFCTVPGLPHDVFIRGWKAQNRAIEGDQVAIRILPSSEWYCTSVGGSSTTPSTSAPVGCGVTPTRCSEMTQQGRLASSPAVTCTPGDEGEGDSASDLLITPSLLPTSPSGGELGLAFTPGLDDLEVEGIRRGMSGLHVMDEGTGSGTEVVPHVAAQLRDMPGWRATGEVVGVLELSSRRERIVGCVRPGSGATACAFLVPCDPRMPRIMLPHSYNHYTMTLLGGNLSLEEAASPDVCIDEDGDMLAHTMVRGAISGWDEQHMSPSGVVDCVLGPCGDLACEVRALLEQEGVDDDDQFNDEVLACLPQSPWVPADKDTEARRDLRDVRVFSIDPPTARDLDDALSVEVLPGERPGGEQLVRVGVHIADVSHFVRPATALDEEAAARSTSTYLPSRVIPMLPRPLCEELCSLNPGVDRFAFSVQWDMTEEGEIRRTWIGRTVIRSCAKLSYNMVQDMIEGKDDGTRAPPGVKVHGPYTWPQIVEDSLRLHRIAMNLRKKRYDNGALRLDNVRLYFMLNEETGLPIDYEVYQQKEANQLVEEFMLAANITTARVVSTVFPDKAMLRCHPPPNSHKMNGLVDTIKNLLPGAPALDTSNAGALQTSLRALCQYVGERSALAEVVTLMCTKPMQTARYFCTGDADDQSSWRHYALAVQHYTHFTSPIRRYPDVIVHRLLAAAIESYGHDWTKSDQAICSDDALAEAHGLLSSEDCSLIAAHANKRKAAAKSVQDGCMKLYLTMFLWDSPKVCQGVVLALGGSRFFDVYIPAFGIDVRVHTEDMLKGGAAALRTYWDAASKVLFLERSSRGPLTTRDEPSFDDVPNADKVGMEVEGAQKMQLPLMIIPLCTVSLLVGAKNSGSGSPAKLLARLWIQ